MYNFGTTFPMIGSKKSPNSMTLAQTVSGEQKCTRGPTPPPHPPPPPAIGRLWFQVDADESHIFLKKGRTTTVLDQRECEMCPVTSYELS